MKYSITVFLSFVVLITVSYGQADDTLFGSTVMNEFMWTVSAQDYATEFVSYDISLNESVEIDIDDTCQGYTSATPIYAVHWRRELSTEAQGLRIFFNNFDEQQDVLLYIEHEDGRIWCNDNAFNGYTNPMITLDIPRTGAYRIWVLTPSLAQNSINGFLYLTLADYYDPINFNPEPTNMPEFVGLVSAAFGSQIYETCFVDEDANQLSISVDLSIADLNIGSNVRMVAYANGLQWFSESQHVEFAGNFVFDFSPDTYGSPFTIHIPLSDIVLNDNVLTIDLDFEVLDLEVSSWVILDNVSGLRDILCVNRHLVISEAFVDNP